VAGEIRADLRAQNRMIVQLFGGTLATMLIGFLGVIAVVVTQG
jgi:hypothetical protein